MNTNEHDTTPDDYFNWLSKLPKQYAELPPPVNAGDPVCKLCNDHGRRDWYKMDPRTGLEADSGATACECRITREINRKMASILADAPKGDEPTTSRLYHRDEQGILRAPLTTHTPGLILRGEWDEIARHLWVLFESSMRRLGVDQVAIRTLTDYEAFNIRIGHREARNMSKEEREGGSYVNTIQDYVGPDHKLVILRTGYYTTNSFSGSVLEDVVSARIAIRRPLWIVERHDNPLTSSYGVNVLDHLQTLGFRIVTFDSPSEVGIAMDGAESTPTPRTSSRRQPATPRHEVEPAASAGLDLGIVQPSTRTRRGRG